MKKAILNAAIDLGTNTCLLLIAEVTPSGHLRVVQDVQQIVGLGRGLDESGSLSLAAQDRALECLKKYAELLVPFGLSPSLTACVATSQARDAKNSAEFFERVSSATGFHFQTLSGDQEAALTFQGVLQPEVDPQNICVIDIGGGSTELIFSDQDQMSLDMGSVRFTERFLISDPVTDEEFWACQQAIDHSILQWAPIKSKRLKIENAANMKLIAVAGTATTLAQWFIGQTEFQANRIDETQVNIGDVHRMVEELKWRTIEQRTQLPGVNHQRADVILAGALILWRSMEFLKLNKCNISTRGLRFGILGLVTKAQ